MNLNHEVGYVIINHKEGEFSNMEKREIYLKQKEENFALYERNKREIEEKYKGRYVAIAQGKLLACAETYQEAWEKVKNSAPEVLHFLIFPAEKGPFKGIIKVV